MGQECFGKAEYQLCIVLRADSEDHYSQATESAGDGTSTQTLKSVGRVNQSPKQRVPIEFFFPNESFAIILVSLVSVAQKFMYHYKYFGNKKYPLFEILNHQFY